MVTNSYKIRIFKTTFENGSEKYSGTVDFKEGLWWFPLTITYELTCVRNGVYRLRKKRHNYEIAYFDSYDECFKIIKKLADHIKSNRVFSIKEVTKP